MTADPMPELDLDAIDRRIAMVGLTRDLIAEVRRLRARVAELEAEVARHAVARGAILTDGEAAELLAAMTARGDAAERRAAELEADRDSTRAEALRIQDEDINLLAHATLLNDRAVTAEKRMAELEIKLAARVDAWRAERERATAAEAAVERVRALSGEFDDEWQQLERDPNRGMDTMGRADGLREASERLDRALDAAGTPVEPKSGTGQTCAEQGRPCLRGAGARETSDLHGWYARMDDAAAGTPATPEPPQ